MRYRQTIVSLSSTRKSTAPEIFLTGVRGLLRRPDLTADLLNLSNTLLRTSAKPDAWLALGKDVGYRKSRSVGCCATLVTRLFQSTERGLNTALLYIHSPV